MVKIAFISELDHLTKSEIGKWFRRHKMLQHSDLEESSHGLTYINIPKLKFKSSPKIPPFHQFTVSFQIFLFRIMLFIYTSRMPSVRTWMSNLALFPIETFSAEMIYRDFFFLFWRRWNRTDQVHSQHICFLWWLPIHKCSMIYLILYPNLTIHS